MVLYLFNWSHRSGVLDSTFKNEIAVDSEDELRQNLSRMGTQAILTIVHIRNRCIEERDFFTKWGRFSSSKQCTIKISIWNCYSLSTAWLESIIDHTVTKFIYFFKQNKNWYLLSSFQTIDIRYWEKLNHWLDNKGNLRDKNKIQEYSALKKQFKGHLKLRFSYSLEIGQLQEQVKVIHFLSRIWMAHNSLRPNSIGFIFAHRHPQDSDLLSSREPCPTLEQLEHLHSPGEFHWFISEIRCGALLIGRNKNLSSWRSKLFSSQWFGSCLVILSSQQKPGLRKQRQVTHNCSIKSER